jgi:hypothetical protein
MWGKPTLSHIHFQFRVFQEHRDINHVLLCDLRALCGLQVVHDV